MTLLRNRTSLLLAISSAGATGAYGQSFQQSLDSFLRQGENETFLGWIVVGLVAGFIGSKIVNRRGEGILLDILLGVVGAFVGGWLFPFFGGSGVRGVNLHSIFVAVVGSVIVLVLYHTVRRSRSWS
jgi:uncharacterized membrane protein YeaQ/YmgE (transglycosylase-associated protein family)